MHYEFVVEDKEGREVSLRMTQPVDFLWGTLVSYIRSGNHDARFHMLVYDAGKLVYQMPLYIVDVGNLSKHKITPDVVMEEWIMRTGSRTGQQRI